ncbi:hypothetical protein TNCV_2662431 [Trichonephila clavipes]|nr:hypothetical protein TNCV_2662431 [Trichonephila clavipes]
MSRRKGLSSDEIANLLRELPENEPIGGELSCFILDSDEDIRLLESYCEESEEIAEKLPENLSTPAGIEPATLGL